MDVPRYHAAPPTGSRRRCASQRGPSLEVVESYPDDKYLPSFLLRGEIEGAVLHVQIATDVEGDNIRVVTMYTPEAMSGTRSSEQGGRNEVPSLRRAIGAPNH
jgi:hypothetical protein